MRDRDDRRRVGLGARRACEVVRGDHEIAIGGREVATRGFELARGDNRESTLVEQDVKRAAGLVVGRQQQHPLHHSRA